jgi:hypothetical protein
LAGVLIELLVQKSKISTNFEISFYGRNNEFKITEPSIAMKISKFTIVALLLILIVAGAAAVNFLTKSNDLEPTKKFAQCLTAAEAKMYGAYWCSHCQDQKAMFGDNWQYVDYIECGIPNSNGQTEVCRAAGITSYPTWDFNGRRVIGPESIEQLGANTGCTLE